MTDEQKRILELETALKMAMDLIDDRPSDDELVSYVYYRLKDILENK